MLIFLELYKNTFFREQVKAIYKCNTYVVTSATVLGKMLLTIFDVRLLNLHTVGIMMTLILHFVKKTIP